VPVLAAKATLSGFRRSCQSAASTTVIESDLGSMLVQYPLRRSRYKHIPSLARQVQDLRVIRQVAAQMRRFVPSLSLSGAVAPPMHGFGCTYQMPVCQAFLLGHQMAVEADYKPSLSCIHSSLAGSCELDCYPILLRNGVKVPRIVKFCFNRLSNSDCGQVKSVAESGRPLLRVRDLSA
jgi:hypothetical protein